LQKSHRSAQRNTTSLVKPSAWSALLCNSLPPSYLLEWTNSEWVDSLEQRVRCEEEGGMSFYASYCQDQLPTACDEQD